MEGLETLQIAIQILQGAGGLMFVVLGWVWVSFNKYQEETRKAIRELEHHVIRLQSQSHKN